MDMLRTLDVGRVGDGLELLDRNHNFMRRSAGDVDVGHLALVLGRGLSVPVTG